VIPFQLDGGFHRNFMDDIVGHENCIHKVLKGIAEGKITPKPYAYYRNGYFYYSKECGFYLYFILNDNGKLIPIRGHKV
jgi:hypothetical protein